MINSNKCFVFLFFLEINWWICFIFFEKGGGKGKGYSILDISMFLMLKNLCKVYLLLSFIDM